MMPFFSKKDKVFPVPIKDGCVEINFELLSNDERDRCVQLLPYLSVKKLSIINSDIVVQDCCSLTHYLPKIVKALFANTHIEELVLDEKFLIKHNHLGLTAYHPDLSKLKHMTSLKSLTLTVEEDADFSQLERYISDRHCKLEHLKIDSGMTVAQVAKVRAMLANAYSLKTYEGPDQDEFQYLLDCKNAILSDLEKIPYAI